MRDVLKIALSACIGIILTGAGSWLVFGQDKVDRAEMVDYVQNQGPWIRDRGEIQLGIKSNTESLSELEKSVNKFVEAQQEYIIEQKVTTQRFSDLIEQLQEQR